ncbi:MAG TPA: DUF6580 family putative transport protein [Bacteroidia bacterium]|nr:DUF6580 family putative transport protein [Bacteroidia bacterium]
MESNKINLRVSVLTSLIFLAAFSRIIPHMPNFSPLGAIGLFGAAYFSEKWQAFLIPIAATWLSDLFINNVIYAQYYPTFTWFENGFYWMYGSYLLITIAAIFIFRKVTLRRVIAGALSSTTIFFLITNLTCFPGNPTYPQNFNGLLTCYAAGIQYMNGTLLGDLFYSGVLFGSFALLQKRFPVLRMQQN